jgi:cytidylate kinase
MRYTHTNMHAHIITLGGLPGSGKSSTAKRLTDALGYQHFSSGDFLRKVAAHHGWTIDEFNRAAEENPKFDHEVDELIRTTGRKDNLIIDSRLAFHWIPQSFKVFLRVDPYTAAARTHSHIHTEGRIGQHPESVEDIHQKMITRIESEKRRYATLYSINYLDESNYDLVVDTAVHPLDEVVQIILDNYKEWLQSH